MALYKVEDSVEVMLQAYPPPPSCLSHISIKQRLFQIEWFVRPFKSFSPLINPRR